MSADRDLLLERLLAGDLDLDSDEAGEFFMSDPDARADFELSRRLEADVQRAGEERHAVVEEALRLAPPPGEERVEAWVEEHFASDEPAIPSRPGLVRWLVPLAAAAVVLLMWRPWAAEPTPPDPGPKMGGELQLLHPVGDVRSVREFRWQYDLGRGESFRLVVYSAEAGGAELVRAEDLEETTWTPDPQQTASWPKALRWEVTVLSGGRAVGPTESASSRLSL